ncbi:MAG: FG-GAP-like repeat-containing protein [Planctomycetota bacterium]
MRKSPLAVVVFSTFVSLSSSSSAVEFETFRTFPLGDTVCIVCVTAMATGDLNGDGCVDVVASVQTPNPPFLSSIIVALNDGSGAFPSWSRFWATGATEPYAIAVGDFTGDGNLDVCTANLSSHNVSLFVGPGDGSFAWSQNTATICLPDGLVVGDLNNDAVSDLFVTSNLDDQGQVLLGTGSGGFTTGSSLVLPSPGKPQLADLDQDGNLDLVVTARIQDEVRVLFGDGTGGLAPSSTLPIALPMGSNPQDLILEDLNADGFIDIATANSSSDDVVIRFGDGAGGFASSASVPAGALASTLHAVHLNGDAFIDLVVVSTFDGDGAVLLGTGAGGFSNVSELDVGQLPLEVASSDLDADGNDDLLVLLGIDAVATVKSSGSGALQQPLYLPSGDQPVGTAVGDVDNDGNVDVVAVTEVNQLVLHRQSVPGAYTTSQVNLAPLDPTEVALADLDGDADLDVVMLEAVQGSIVVGNGDGLGGFSVGAAIATGFSLASLAVADVTGDGNLDVLALDPGNDALIVVPGNGGGGFGAPVNYSAPLIPVDLTTGDYNNDGALDVVVLTQGTLSGDPRLYYFAGTTGGTLQMPSVIMTLPEVGFDVVSGDFDGDGILDLATASGLQTPRLRLLSGDGAGGFFSSGVEIMGGAQQDLLAVDVDGDGRRDVVALSILEAPVAVFESSSGTFAPVQSFGVGAWPSAVASGDLDGDGQIDLAVACRDSDAVAVLFNRGQGGQDRFLRGDVSGDGGVALNDAVLILGALFLGQVLACPDAADIGDDGALNILDAVQLLNFLFVPSSAAPQAPYPACGSDATADGLTPCMSPSPSSC